VASAGRIGRIETAKRGSSFETMSKVCAS